MTRNTTYAIELRAGDPLPVSSTWIGGITSQSVSTGVQVNTEVTAGDPNPRYGEVGSVIPAASFTTLDLKTLLTAIGTTGECLIGLTDLGFKMWALKRKACGAIDTSGTPGVHSSFCIPNGLIVPVTLSASHGSRASLSAQVFSYWDGTNDPLIPAHSLAAPSATFPDDVNGYHLGTVAVAGYTLTKKTSVTINYGISITPQSEDGDIYSRSLLRASVKPTVSITCYDVGAFKTSGALKLQGDHATHANTSIVLRKKVLGEGSYASGANHIEYTIDGVARITEIGGSGHGPHAVQVEIDGLSDGTNAMLVQDLAYTLA